MSPIIVRVYLIFIAAANILAFDWTQEVIAAVLLKREAQNSVTPSIVNYGLLLAALAHAPSWGVIENVCLGT